MGNAGQDGQQIAPTQVFVRPLGTPLPMGFLALAIASFVAAGSELGWLAPSQQHLVALVPLALTAPLQLIACIYGYLSRDAIAGTGMGVLAGSWALIGLTLLTSAPKSHSPALGLLLCGSAVALWVPVVASKTKKLAASAVMVCTSVRFFLTAAYELTGSATWKHVAGGWGLFLAVVAVYAAMAFELESSEHRTVLPTGRLGRASNLLIGSFEEEMATVVHEAGVRRTL